MDAFRVETPPILDGEVLTDPAYAEAKPATGFWQTTPDEGQPSSEETEVFVVYTADTLYVGVVCHDRNPKGIVVADSRRDSSLAETDAFQIVFDTYNDSQSGFLFGTNPVGLQYDGQVTKDGEVDVGATGGFNLNWDGVWKVKAKITDAGWSAEFAIPFRTLRFPKGSPQTWGVNFQRSIRRHKELAYWSPLPRQFDLDRISLAGRLNGVEVPKEHYLQLTPYVLGEAVRGREGRRETETDADGGFDLKYGISPSLALDVTYNTDFAQVEADVQQINLDRFSLFFPEKRPFFLENSGTFRVGIPTEVELFFSRRIGLGPGGEEIPILGGTRLSGKAGKNNIGLLYMETDDTGGDFSEDRFAVARVSRDLKGQSSIGMIFTRREGKGSFSGPDDHGTTFGIDGKWGISQNAEIKGFAAKTSTPGIDEDDHAYYLGGRWNSEKVVAELSYAEVGAGFNPEVGFLTRSGYRRPEIFALSRHRPKNRWGLHEIRPHIYYKGYWDFDGFYESGVFHAGVHWEWKNGNEIHTGFNIYDDGVKTPFEIFPGVVIPAKDFSRTEIQLVGYTNRARPVGVELTVIAGEFFGGDRVTLIPSVRFRTTEKFVGELAWNRNDISLPYGDFDTDLGRLRLAYSFTPSLFIESLFQYNTRADEWSSNIRFGWRNSASSGLYLVYNEIQELGEPVAIPQRRLIVKYSRLFNLL
jgi:hypothetical protein